jgi:hypothetical protein
VRLKVLGKLRKKIIHLIRSRTRDLPGLSLFLVCLGGARLNPLETLAIIWPTVDLMDDVQRGEIGRMLAGKTWRKPVHHKSHIT